MMALVIAARHTELLGVTTVAGNAPLDATTRNARVVLDMIGSEVPLHRGAEKPLVAPARHAEYVHGKSGLDGADLPPPTRPADSSNAVDFIVDTCRDVDDVWLVPTGPLTNIALALRKAPDVAERIAGISLMGGGTFGNCTAVAEFNIWADPDAAAEVFSYGGRLIMSGLDVTHRLQATPERIAKVKATSGRLAGVLGDLLDFYSRGYVERHLDMRGAAIHDACAVLALTHPNLFTSSHHHVEVETSGQLTVGMTLIDQRTLRDLPTANCEVLWDVDSDAAFDVLIEAIAAFSR